MNIICERTYNIPGDVNDLHLCESGAGHDRNRYFEEPRRRPLIIAVLRYGKRVVGQTSNLFRQRLRHIRKARRDVAGSQDKENEPERKQGPRREVLPIRPPQVPPCLLRGISNYPESRGGNVFPFPFGGTQSTRRLLRRCVHLRLCPHVFPVSHGRGGVSAHTASRLHLFGLRQWNEARIRHCAIRRSLSASLGLEMF